MDTLTLLGRDWPVTVPRPFVIREELVLGFQSAGEEPTGMHCLRIMAAAIALSTPIGREARLDYAKAGHSALAYGGAAYSYLREKGVPAAAIVEHGGALIRQIRETLPGNEAVADKRDFIAPPEAS